MPPPPKYVRDALLSKGSASSAQPTASSSANVAKKSSPMSTIMSSRTLVVSGVLVSVLAVVAAIAYSLFHAHYVVCHDGKFLSIACTSLHV